VGTLLVALTGGLATFVLARAARRFAVADRLRPRRANGSLPAWLGDPLAAALRAAALDVLPRQAVQIWLLALFVAGAVGGAVAPSVGVVLVVTFAAGGPVGLWLARDRGARRVAAEVPVMLERVASELRSGGTVATAVRAAAAGDGALAADFSRVERRVLLGASFVDALRAWAREVPAPGVGAAAGALALCSAVGGRSADALDGMASSLRERLGVLAEARALSSQARLSALVIGLAPIVYLLGSAAIDPGSHDALLGTGIGRLCAIGGLALEGVGVWWMRRIVEGGTR
jgi:tight adherence protein B